MKQSSRREQLFLLMAISCLGITHLAMISPALPDLARALGVSVAVIGWVQGSVALPGVLLAIFVGYLADRFGGKKVILVCLMIFTVFGGAGFLATSFPMLFALRILQGVGSSGIVAVAIILIGELFDDDQKRLRALGTNLALMYLTQMVMPIVAGVVATGGAFRPFLLYLAGAPIWLWGLRMTGGEPKESIASPLRHARAARADLHRRRTGVDLLGLIVFTVMGVIVYQGATLTGVPLLLDEVFGTGTAGRGLVVSAFQMGAIVTALGVVRVVSGRISGQVLSLGLWLMSIGLLTVLIARFPAMISIGLAFTGAGFGLVITLAQRDVIGVCSPAYRGLVVLTWVAGVRVAQVVGPPGVSFTTEALGPRPVFLLAAVMTTLAALTWRPLRRWLRGLVYT